MFRIGDFSKLNKISIKTLRYYDEIDLLKPQKIDNHTGYRYYSAQQIPRLHRILALKDVGFSLQEISILLDDEATKHEMFLKKTHEIKIEIRKKEEQLLRLQTVFTRTQEEKSMNYHIVTKQIEPIQVAAINEKLNSALKQSELWGELINHIDKHHVKRNAPIAIYNTSTKEDTIHLKVCMPITKNIQETENIKIEQLPVIEQAACIIHKGTNDTLTNAYTAVQQWIEQNQYEVTGPVREVHIEGYHSTLNPEEHVTEIQIPVMKRNTI
ncbi:MULTISPECIES: MerR family transcriptional regulator [Bacillus]|uniref:MerR family transcriptional regulator n=1 Tax=Bacillus TaxID=1386 RepID=UPI0002DF0E32|nr:MULTISPECIES: MerR family transcriptional regulator [Bacillus]MBO1582001.1 MerR family transcriptional regulator [Bacillus sp. XF8]MBY0596169.1 MerR family transcriptional regulator [Bacillus bingmayongensis]